jgi:hypothetical protein
MQLLQSDVLNLITQIPYLYLAKQSATKRFIGRLIEDGAELTAILAQFPAVQYEPLDQHYVLLRCLGVLSEELISDLCLDYTWRGIVLASWLVALAPEARYRKHLKAASARVPHNQWLVELAIAEIDGVTWNTDAELQGQIQHLRTLLSVAPRPAIVFRRAPGPQQFAQVEAERERIKSAYLAGGLHTALEELKHTEIWSALTPRK